MIHLRANIQRLIRPHENTDKTVQIIQNAELPVQLNLSELTPFAITFQVLGPVYTEH